jgi:MFS family permease
MPRPAQLLRVLRHRDFRLLWLANSASVVGDRIVMVALALFVVRLTGSPTDLGLVFCAYLLPLIGFLLVGGVFADRLPRHLVVVVTDLVRCALHGLLALLILTGDVRIWHVCAIGVLFGSAEAFYRPAASGLLPQTVPEDEIQEANAVTRMFENVAQFAGPALAALLVVGAGPATAFALDAATFLVSAALLVRLRLRPRERGAPAPPRRGDRIGLARRPRGLRRGALAAVGVGHAGGVLRRAVRRGGADDRRSARSSPASTTGTSRSSATCWRRSAPARSPARRSRCAGGRATPCARA